jgi:rod shape-determining protein MreC
MTWLGYNAYRNAWFATSASCIAYPLLKLNQWWIEPMKKSKNEIDDVDALKRQNQLLHLQNVRLRAALSYAQKIKELVSFNKRYEGRGHIAHVIAKNMTQDGHYFLIDGGSRQGIAKDMVVLYNNNLIGKIIEIYPWYSKVCLVTDRNCKVAAYCVETKAQGIYEGCNDQMMANLNFVNHLSDIKPGDLVLSSGEGLVFPEGFALGRVGSFTNDGLYKRITVEPLCDIKQIDYCLVMAKGEALL